MICPYCDSEEIEYIGISDGGGEYGLSLCHEWRCLNCGAAFEDGCIEVGCSESREDIPILPPRQVEFLLALRAGRPVARNAATRMALRQWGLITNTNNWNAITLTVDGKRVADHYAALKFAGSEDKGDE